MWKMGRVEIQENGPVPIAEPSISCHEANLRPRQGMPVVSAINVW